MCTITLYLGQRSFSSWPYRPTSAFRYFHLHQGVPLLAEVEVLWLRAGRGWCSMKWPGRTVPARSPEETGWHPDRLEYKMTARFNTAYQIWLLETFAGW